ncbi:MAG: hypothetical protein SNJ72_01615 [Fimbriimonadales bacterium]
MRAIRWFSVVALVSVWSIVHADGRGYEDRTAPINVGVVTFGPNDTNVRDTRTFYALDRRTDIKPAGLALRNPVAPAGVTRVDPRYWLVDVASLTDNQLARFHVLLISRTSWNGMTVTIREKLRRFVDSGGTLWVDVPEGGTSGQLFFPQVGFLTGGGAVNSINLNHPVLRGYFVLTPVEVAQMGLRGRLGGGGTLDVSANNPPLQPLASAGSAPVMAVATYGSGRIFVTSAGIAAAITAPIRSLGAPPAVIEARLEAVPEPELKFAYNLLRWASSSTAPNINQRGANALPDRYGAPLGLRWRDQNTPVGSNAGGAVIYGGLIFQVVDGRLICYDAIPNRDLDADGRADDGIPDLERGEQYDKVWEVNIGGSVSPPVIMETLRGTLVLVVADVQLRAYFALPRDPSTNQILPTQSPVWTVNPTGAAFSPATTETTVPAPIVIENNLILVPTVVSVGAGTSAGFYAVQTDGSSAQVVLASGSVTPPEWFQPRASSGGNWLLPPVAGLVPNTGVGGGNDIMVYFGTRRDIGGGNVVEGVQSFWVGAKGEVLTPSRNPDGVYQNFLRSRITGRMRYYAPGIGNPLHPRVYRINEVTGAIEDITAQCTFNAVEQGRIAYSGPVDGFIFVADYYIDWAFSNNFNNMFRSFASLPAITTGSPVPQNRLRGYTLAPNGVLYITTGTDSIEANTANGNLIALLEQDAPQGSQARAGSVILWRWQSHGGYTQIVPGSTQPVLVDGSAIWNEPNQFIDQALGSFIQYNHQFNPNRRAMNFTFRSAPVYADGVVYALAEGTARVGPIGFPYLMVLAFDAEPEQFVIDLGAPIATTGDVRISQRDYGRSGPNPSANILSNLTYSPNSPNPNIKVDFASGQIRFTGFATASGGGQVNLLENVISISQPVQISIGTSFNTFVDPDKQLGNWSNLRWYTVLLGTQAQGALLAVGDNLYIPVKVLVPDRFPPSERFGVIAIAADPYRFQPDLSKQRAQAGVFPRVSTDLNRDLNYKSILRWPFIDDLIEDLELDPNPSLGEIQAFIIEFFRRYGRTLNLDGVGPLAAGDGLLVAGSGGGLFAYSQQSTLIADEGRLMEVDMAGRVIWSTENTLLEFFTGSLVPSKQRYALTPNARVYRYQENQFLVVEPERNRVAILDRAGSEVRTITRFIPDRVLQTNPDGSVAGIIDVRDPNAFPSNFVAGSPETLRNPTDVTVWTEYVPANRNPYLVRQPLEYWIHYTISDAGNSRVVDVVDRFDVDPNTFVVRGPVLHPQLGPMLGVLYWTSPSEQLGRLYRYVSAQRFEYFDGTQTRIGFVTVVQNIAASGVEVQTTPTSAQSDPATPYAGMLTIQVIRNGQTETLYIRKMRLPDGREVPILSPVSVDASRRSLNGRITQAGLYLLVTTSTGVYELQVPLTGTIGDTLNVSWMLTNEAYSNGVRRRIKGLRLQTVGNDPNAPPVQPILFKPTQARYLANGNVLIVNSYTGSTTLVASNSQLESYDFPGEVFELNASNYDPDFAGQPTEPYGFTNSSILWSTVDRPILSGSSPLRKPSSADRSF